MNKLFRSLTAIADEPANPPSAFSNRKCKVGVIGLSLVALCAALGYSVVYAQSTAPPAIQLPSIVNPSGATLPNTGNVTNPINPKSTTTITQQSARLLKEGQPSLALEALEKGLEIAPRDPQMRFLKGVALSDLKRYDQSISIFIALTQEFPELPEPYNNLAVMYANAGDLQKAKNALEDAVRALPNYALGHENLGDVYIQLAAQQFESAAKNNPKNKSASQKLTLARDWVNQLLKMNVQ
jgi:tetratricopeptide (TPR) repeat protein